MFISKTASKNVAFPFKTSTMSLSVLETQGEVITRKTMEEEIRNEEDKQALDDLGYNVDLYLYISNQLPSCTSTRLIFQINFWMAYKYK